MLRQKQGQRQEQEQEQRQEQRQEQGQRQQQVVAPFGLHSGLRQSGSAFGAVFLAGLKPCPSEFEAWQS